MRSLLLFALFSATTAAAGDLPALDFAALEVGKGGEYSVTMMAGPMLHRQADLRVLQVLGPREMLVTARILSTPVSGGIFGRASESNVVVMVRTDTTGLVDDRPWEPKGRCFRVANTTTYESATGPATVFALEEIDRAKFLIEVEEKTWPARWAQGKRIWRDRTGQFEVEAIYDGSEPGHVWLMKQDRSRLKVPLTKLSDRDRREALRLSRAAESPAN